MTRVFLTSSHLSSLMASIIAVKSSKPEDKNYLIIDHYYKKDALISLIQQCDEIFTWSKIIDLSVHIPDQTDLKPRLKKRILRKMKALPLVNSIYNKLLIRHQEKYAYKKSREISETFKNNELNECDQLFLLTQTALNSALIKVFPNASICYYEHGLGDYYYFWRQNLDGIFYGLFGNEFQYFVRKKLQKNISVFGDFEKQDLEFAFEKFHSGISVNLSNLKGKKLVLFLMDALEGYNPPENLWSDYLNQSLTQVEKPGDFVVLVKPHPNQSNGVIQQTRQLLEKKNLNYVFLDDPIFISLSVEIIFSYLQEEVHYFISTFSSSIFYLAKFYPGKCEFILMYDFVEKYLRNGPKQYLDHFYGLEPLIQDVFMTTNIKRIK
jgi:hypothetical protein